MFSLLQAEGSNNSESSALYSMQSSSDSGGKKSRKSRRKAEKKSKESSVTVRFCVSEYSSRHSSHSTFSLLSSPSSLSLSPPSPSHSFPQTKSPSPSPPPSPPPTWMTPQRQAAHVTTLAVQLTLVSEREGRGEEVVADASILVFINWTQLQGFPIDSHTFG